MTERSFGAAERNRHWLFDAAIGGVLALGVITAAKAALPRTPPRPLVHRAVVRLVAVRPVPALHLAPPPAPPPVLVAFQEPVAGGVVGSPFGYRQLPWEEKARLHAGEDIEAPAGALIAAAADGVITRVGVDAGYGRFVELKHAAGLVTRYGHMGPFLPGVAPGVAVKAGTPVGRIGSTGTSTGAHLHFEIRDDENRPLNPELLLGRRFATERELPLRQALRAPRTIRVAFVSSIPASKRAAMRARLAEDAADDADSQDGAPSVQQAAVDASATRAPDGRLHARYAIAK